MASIEESIEIAVPPSSLFRLCHDADKRPQWDERVVRVQILTPGPVRNGTLVRVDVGRPGKPVFTWDGEIADWQFPLSSTVKVLDAAPSSPFVEGNETWQFGQAGGGTRFTLVWEYKPRSLFGRIADALWTRSAARRDVRRSLANLKALAESG